MKINKKKIKILCTLGPSSMNEWTISRLSDLGVDIFRINLSHVEINELESLILNIRGYTNVPICLDTEGAQVRSRLVKNNKIYLKEGEVVELTGEQIVGNQLKISLSPGFVLHKMEPGDLVSIDFDSVLLKVIQRRRKSVLAKVLSNGYVGSNKAVNIDRNIELPVMSEKDKAAVKIGLKHKIRHFALSFASSKEDVKKFRTHVGRNAYIISKIENKKGVKNLDDILYVSDAILIDRGDLSREEPIEKIPFIQKYIIQKAKSKKVPVFVATNLLESMVKNKKPTRAEANDIVNTLLDGANGLVLAAETAIGLFPIDCVMMVSKIIQHYLSFSRSSSVEKLEQKEFPLLPEPHGGKLVNRIGNKVDELRLKKYKILKVGVTELLDAEQISIGTFSPLDGFMNKNDLESVIENFRLSNGIIWPIPIVLQTNKKEARRLALGDTVALELKNTGQIFALLHLEDIYHYNLERVTEKIYGTNDFSHHGVKLLKEKGDVFLGGKVTLLRRLPSENKHYELTPVQVRTIFENKGWSRVVGFHTRNVIHRAHEYIQLSALERYKCDGLFIHPVVGPKKSGDYTADIILKSYELMLNKYYPKKKVFLSAFENYSRYSGPREAVFTALCRKNFGCSHFIVGRDHTGLGAYYKPDGAHKLFDSLGEIGIVPIFFNQMNYCKRCKEYIEHCEHGIQGILSISGTRAREMLKLNKQPPAWFMRRDISNLVLGEINKGNQVFVK